tara:strand:- start:43 stop:651 length:609 start_codon:yes stop_codon:yes gene_type:complete
MNFKKKIPIALALILTLVGCDTMNTERFSNGKPKFILEKYFDGETSAWGIVEDRFGNVKRQFIVDINGYWDGETLTLKEDFLFDDGEKSFREWKITKNLDGSYSGTADDVVGIAKGIASGNTLNWTYVLDLKLSDTSSVRVNFDDWMFLQPGGVLLNKAKMSKFGINLGQILISFSKGEANKQHFSFSNELKTFEGVAAVAQ